MMDQVVVVTGAGIGRATACLFAERGYQVLAVGRREAPLAETAQLGAHLAGGIVPFSADVSDEAAVTRMTAKACELGRYTHLVNNAGVGWSFGLQRPGSMAALRETDLPNWREVLGINLDAVYLTCHAALQHFGEGCSIVNISSGGGLRGMQDAHAYATAKAGVINLTRSLARTYGPEGIRSNVVAPGFVDTDMVEPVLGSDMNPFADDVMRFQVTPMGRPGTPEEVARTIVFLALDGTYGNGTVLQVDGGSLA